MNIHNSSQDFLKFGYTAARDQQTGEPWKYP
jgi:hypothetical protein